MSQDQSDIDVNKAFEDLLFAEDIAQKSAYAEGYLTGQTQLTDGYHLGYHRASLIAAQLGYYSGVIEQYLQINPTVPIKIKSLAEEILQDIYNIPRHNDETVDISKSVETIKLKYAKFCSQAKLNPLYPEADRLNF